MRYVISILLFIAISACKKNNPTTPTTQPCPAICDVRGTYTGTAIASGSSTPSPMTYQLRDNNLAVGSVTVSGPATTYGGYRGTCDSIIISSWYNANGSYYLLKGVLSNNRSVLSGTFQNITSPNDFGNFNLTKQ